MEQEQEQEQEKEKESNPADETSRLEIDKDYISKVPYEILAQILSIYPLDSGSKAVAIFTGLWSRPCIQHEGRTVEMQDFESVITEFLINFDEKKPLKRPRKLEFHFNRGSVVTVSIGLNSKLSLDFSKGIQEFPRQFGWEIVLNTMDFAQPSPYPFSIKTLKLTSLNYISSELVSSLINKFRYVETLIIVKCNGLRSLKIQGLAKLTNLIIQDCVDLKSVFLETLELKSLRYNGFLSWFSFKNLTYLEDVMMDFEGPGFKNFNHQLYDPLLRAIRDAKVLTLHGWMYKEVFGPLLSLKQNEQHFRFSKLEDLWWIDASMEDHNINSLFSFLKFSPSLKRLFITIDPRSYMTHSVGDGESSKNGQKWRLGKLKVVKVEGFKEEEDVMLLKEHLLQVFSVEPRLVEVRQGMHARCLIRIPKRQAIGKEKGSNKLKFCYKFVEEVEGNTGLCSKHPHMP